MRKGDLTGSLLIMNGSVYKPRVVYFGQDETNIITDSGRFLERDLLNAPAVCKIVNSKYTVLDSLIQELSNVTNDSINRISTSVTNLLLQTNELNTSVIAIDLNLETLNNVTTLQTSNINILMNSYDNLTSQVTNLMYTVYPLIINISGGGIYEIGTTPVVTLTWSVSRNGENVIPTVLKINNINVSSPLSYNPTENTTYVLHVEYNGQTADKSISVDFVYPSYCGIVASDFVANSTTIVAMNKTIKDSSHFDITYSELDNQKVCYAYPKSYGNLSSIKDSNGFEYINSYILSNVVINNIDYNVYLLLSSTSITNFKQIYS